MKSNTLKTLLLIIAVVLVAIWQIFFNPSHEHGGAHGHSHGPSTDSRTTTHDTLNPTEESK